jgi:glycosyltransferase involved in cell wall biosynthesis
MARAVHSPHVVVTKRPDSARTRVMYLLPAAGFGGAERQGLVHIRHLARHGVEVVPVVGPGPIVPRALAAEGVTDAEFLPNMPEDVSGSPRRWFGFVRDWRATQAALARIVHEREIDIIFASRSVGWVTATAVARRFDLPIVWRGGSRITRALERLALRLLAPRFQPDLFLANCNAVAADFAPHIAHTELLANAIDTARFDPRRVRPERDRRAPLVGLAARPAPGKGLELLVDIVARVASSAPDVRFAIAGDFPSRPHYEQMFAAAGLADRVAFLGHVTDMPAFYARCDVAVLTSDERSIEGSPNALLEAMAMERPIVATRVGGVPELVEDGEHGLLVPAGDAAAFAQRLVALVRNDVQRRSFGAAARARVIAKHGIDAVVGRLATLLRETQANHGAHQPSPPVTGAPQVAYGDA